LKFEGVKTRQDPVTNFTPLDINNHLLTYASPPILATQYQMCLAYAKMTKFLVPLPHQRGRLILSMDNTPCSIRPQSKQQTVLQMESCYSVSNPIHFHCQGRRRKGLLLKHMQYKKILPYICNDLRLTSLIIYDLFQNLRNRAQTQSEVNSHIPIWNRLSIIISMPPGLVKSLFGAFGLYESPTTSKLVILARCNTLKSYSSFNKAHLASLLNVFIRLHEPP
jgi:hypothetical protein